MRILTGIGILLCFAYVNCEIFPECDGKPSRSYVASYRKNGCRSFIFCFGENSFEDSCPKTLAFNPVASACDFRQNVECDTDADDDDDVDDEMNNISTAKLPSIISKKPIVTGTTKQRPTPNGKPLKTSPTNSPTISSTVRGNSIRPVPTRKPSGSSTKRPKTNSPTRLTSLISTTMKKKSPTASVPPNRPSPPPPTTASKKPTQSPTKTSSSGKTDSPIRIPTPPGGQKVPDRSKESVSTTLSKEKGPTKRPSSVPSKTKTSTAPSTKTQTELLTSSTAVTNNIPAGIQEQCIKKSVGSFAYPGDCHYYYRCLRGVLSKQECPKGFGWDDKSRMCSSKGCLK